MKSKWRRPAWFGMFLLLVNCLVLALAAAQSSPPAASAQPAAPAWKLVWSDEFNGPNGSAVDASKWVSETGGGGWGNDELEYYTDAVENASQQDGNLVIKVLQEKYTGADGVTRNYTSARLKTLANFRRPTAASKRASRFLAARESGRPSGCWATTSTSRAGPTAARSTSWRTSARSRRWFTARFTARDIPASTASALLIGLPGGQADLPTTFTCYAVEWEPNAIRFYVDDHLYATRTPADLPKGAKWVYDHPFFLLLNVAVGGGWPGSPDATTVFPQTMLVDYVRVYERANSPVGQPSTNI